VYSFHPQHEQGLPGTPGGTSGKKQDDASRVRLLGFRILRFKNLCPMRSEEYLYSSEKQVPGCGALAGHP